MLPSGFEPELAEFFFHLEIKTFELNRKSAVLAELDDRSLRRCLSNWQLVYLYLIEALSFYSKTFFILSQ